MLVGGCSAATSAGQPLPTEKDLEAAQIEHYKQSIKTDPKAITACNGFINFRAEEPAADGIASVTYEELRSDVPDEQYKPMRAKLKNDAGKWVWVDGDAPRCAYATFDIDLNTGKISSK